MTLATNAVIADLAVCYPQVPLPEIRAVVASAARTVTAMLGEPDAQTTCDLAQLRLDIRTCRTAA